MPERAETSKTEGSGWELAGLFTPAELAVDRLKLLPDPEYIGLHRRDLVSQLGLDAGDGPGDPVSSLCDPVLDLLVQPDRVPRGHPQLLQPVPLLEQLGLAAVQPLDQLVVCVAGDGLGDVLFDKPKQHRVHPVGDAVVDLPDQVVLPVWVARPRAHAARTCARSPPCKSAS